MGIPQTKPQEDEDLTEQEIAQRRDRVIKRMLNTPPQKHKDEPKRRKPKDNPSR